MNKIVYIVSFLIGLLCIVSCEPHSQVESSTMSGKLLQADAVGVVGFPDVELDPKLVQLISDNLSDTMMPLDKGVPGLDGFVLKIKCEGEFLYLTLTGEFWEIDNKYYQYKNMGSWKRVYRRLEKHLFDQ